MKLLAVDVQCACGSNWLRLAPHRASIETALVRALDRLLSATVDADLADGVELSVRASGAREQALEALALANGGRDD